MGFSTIFTWLSNPLFFCNVLVWIPSSGSTILAHEQGNAQYTRGCSNTLPLHTRAILESSICATLEYFYDVNIKRNPTLKYSYDVSIKDSNCRIFLWCYQHKERNITWRSRHFTWIDDTVVMLASSSLIHVYPDQVQSLQLEYPVALSLSSPLHGAILTCFLNSPHLRSSSEWLDWLKWAATGFSIFLVWMS